MTTQRRPRPLSDKHGLSVGQTIRFLGWVQAHPFIPQGFDIRAAIIESIDNTFDVLTSDALTVAQGTFASLIEEA